MSDFVINKWTTCRRIGAALRLQALPALLALLTGCGAGQQGGQGSNGNVTDGSGDGADANADGRASSVRLVALDGALLVDWVAPEGGADGYWILVRTGLPGPPWDAGLGAAGTSPIRTGADTSWTLSGLQNGVAYFVAVAVDEQGVPGPASEWAMAVPTRDADSMVLIPAGVFWMGAEPFVHAADEEPAHPVYLDAFWMDRYVTSNAEYRACVDAGACSAPTSRGGYLQGITEVDDYFDSTLYDDYPVVNLDHGYAAEYCEWLDKRLPTEAEWERAARGDSTVGERPYPWGAEQPGCERANFNDDSIWCVGGTTPVGAYAHVNQSPYGVAEMAGNVWQWTADWYAADAYATSKCYNPSGPDDGEERVLRGGAWYYLAPSLGVTYRNHFAPEFAGVGEGFGDYRGFGVRCVKPAIGVPCDESADICEIPGGWNCDGETVDADAGTEPDVTDAVVADVADGIDVTDAADATDVADAPDVADADGSALDTTSDVTDALDTLDVSDSDGGDSADVTVPDCTWPADKPGNPTACQEAIPPACPSGWSSGCIDGPCNCVTNLSVEPGPCAEDTYQVTLGWRSAFKVFSAFSPGEEFEMCEGFQGGGTFHIAVFARVENHEDFNDAPSFTADILALARVDGLRVAGNTLHNAAFTKQPNGSYLSSVILVIFEPCSTQSLLGKNSALDITIRKGQEAFGRAKMTIKLIDDVEGPYLDPGKENPC